jgi:hypothetical protein
MAPTETASARRTRLLADMKAIGMVYPIETWNACEQTGLLLSRACAMLMLETSGGHNEFGHDPGNPVQGGEVTEARYAAMRANVEAGQASQGVGPCQLTSIGLLDEADRKGGAWLVGPNMLVGFGFLHGLQGEYGTWGGFRSYNGSGAAADAYAFRAVALATEYHDRMQH